MSGEKRVKCPECGNKYIAGRLFESFDCPHCIKVTVENGKYTVTGQVMYPDYKHSGRMYSYETFLKAVVDYEKTNNSDEENP